MVEAGRSGQSDGSDTPTPFSYGRRVPRLSGFVATAREARRKAELSIGGVYTIIM